MLNPNCAVERVKNHLAYKVGSCVLYNKKKKFSFFILLYKLYKIKSEHYKELKNYQVLIKLFPSLRYPKLEECSNYKECIKVKFHLSYMLGQAILEADKNKFKGGYFRLWQDIKRVNQEYKDIKIFLQQYNLFIERLNNIEIQNIDLLIKNFHNVFYILNFHKDYQEIINVIIDNFDYFLNNFDTIEEWLLSDDFNERYKKENHPYPPLLDPIRLNASDKISYQSLDVYGDGGEVAWKLNLPLPNKYKFIFLFNGCSGSEAMQHFLMLCGVETRAWAWFNPKDIFKINYQNLLNENMAAPCLPSITTGDYEKLFYLVDGDFDIVTIMRDPISVLKAGLNHIESYKIPLEVLNYCRNIECYNQDFENLFPVIWYAYSGSTKVNIKDLGKLLDNSEHYFTFNKRINMLKNNHRVVCINFEDINSQNIINTMNNLANRYGFKTPKKEYEIILTSRINLHQGLLHLPVNINYKMFQIIITTPYLFSLDIEAMSRYINITDRIFNSDIIMESIVIICSQEQYEVLIKNQEWDQIKEYIEEYIESLRVYIENCKSNLVTEKDILIYLRQNSNLRLKFLKYIEENIKYIRENYPEYVETWTYYQEFEKMCEELDKKE
ncbi:TPA: DUF2972 domain-containing protein [Campylobacter coli]|nr:DUF2972 domain-containing protein [Campylobacter coli]